MAGETTQIRSHLRLDRLAVADVMTIDPVTIGVAESVEAAERLMAAYGIRGLPVVDADGHLVGVVSQTDLMFEGGPSLSQLVRGHGSTLRVGEIMSSPPVTVEMSATLVEAARLMREARVHRLVVVDDQATPIGVLSATDYVAIIADA